MANPLNETPRLCVVSMIVVCPAVAHEPVHGVHLWGGIKVLLSFRKLNFKSRHFYIVLRWLGQVRFYRRMVRLRLRRVPPRLSIRTADRPDRAAVKFRNPLVSIPLYFGS